MSQSENNNGLNGKMKGWSGISFILTYQQTPVEGDTCRSVYISVCENMMNYTTMRLSKSFLYEHTVLWHTCSVNVQCWQRLFSSYTGRTFARGLLLALQSANTHIHTYTHKQWKWCKLQWRTGTHLEQVLQLVCGSVCVCVWESDKITCNLYLFRKEAESFVFTDTFICFS